jgi:hypothetical protein
MTKRETVYEICKCIWWAVKVVVVMLFAVLAWLGLGYFLIALGEISPAALVLFLLLLVVGFLAAIKFCHR